MSRIVVVALLASLGGTVAAQAPAPGITPDPEMRRLSKAYVGTWTYTEAYPKPAGATAAMAAPVNTGVYTSELGPGGMSIVNRFHSKGPAGESEGLIVMTWDSNEKAYKEYVFGTGVAGAIVATGQWENDALVYRIELSAGRTKVTLRNVTTFPADGKLVSDQFQSANGSPESLVVHVEATKK